MEQWSNHVLVIKNVVTVCAAFVDSCCSPFCWNIVTVASSELLISVNISRDCLQMYNALCMNCFVVVGCSICIVLYCTAVGTVDQCALSFPRLATDRQPCCYMTVIHACQFDFAWKCQYVTVFSTQGYLAVSIQCRPNISIFAIRLEPILRVMMLSVHVVTETMFESPKPCEPYLRLCFFSADRVA